MGRSVSGTTAGGLSVTGPGRDAGKQGSCVKVPRKVHSEPGAGLFVQPCLCWGAGGRRISDSPGRLFAHSHCHTEAASEGGPSRATRAAHPGSSQSVRGSLPPRTVTEGGPELPTLRLQRWGATHSPPGPICARLGTGSGFGCILGPVARPGPELSVCWAVLLVPACGLCGRFRCASGARAS